MKMRDQADVGDGEDREWLHVLRARTRDPEGGAEQRRALENENLRQAQAGQVA
jgi:hypothetical protein